MLIFQPDNQDKRLIVHTTCIWYKICSYMGMNTPETGRATMNNDKKNLAKPQKYDALMVTEFPKSEPPLESSYIFPAADNPFTISRKKDDQQSRESVPTHKRIAYPVF